jgi:heme/copper-type cytochrome/quinol oxidase subunit 2
MVRLSRAGWLKTGAIAVAGLLLTAWADTSVHGAPQEPAQTQRDFTIVARKYAFTPVRVEVDQDDLVKVTLKSADIAHSFTIDGYRIAKRVGAGQTVTFEFRANQPGTFRIYCNLKQDDRCREMRGELVVRKK